MSRGLLDKITQRLNIPIKVQENKCLQVRAQVGSWITLMKCLRVS